jgi:hypothetical protein
MDSGTQDAQLRQAAFNHVNRLTYLRGGILDAADLEAGFQFAGERVPLINRLAPWLPYTDEYTKCYTTSRLQLPITS